MPIIIPPASIQNLQQVEAYVSGPDTANRLLTIGGQFDLNLGIGGGPDALGQVTNTVTLLVGPVLTHNQFFKAVATGSLAKTSLDLQIAPSYSVFSLNSVNAEWDDQSGQVAITMEFLIQAFGAGNSATVLGLSFQTTILYMAAQ